MKSPRIFVPLVLLILLSILVSMFSCGGLTTSASLEGTWTLTTTSETEDDIGNGTYTLTLTESSTELGMDFYSGEGVIEGVPYAFRVQIKYERDTDGNTYYLFFSEEEEATPSENRIKCYSPGYSRAAASGMYTGEGTYSHYGTGWFNTLKQ